MWKILDFVGTCSKKTAKFSLLNIRVCLVKKYKHTETNEISYQFVVDEIYTKRIYRFDKSNCKDIEKYFNFLKFNGSEIVYSKPGKKLYLMGKCNDNLRASYILKLAEFYAEENPLEEIVEDIEFEIPITNFSLIEIFNYEFGENHGCSLPSSMVK